VAKHSDLDYIIHGNMPIKPGDKNPRPKLDGDIGNPPVPLEIKMEAEELGLWYVEMSIDTFLGTTAITTID
jgi:hypothetical protein